MSIFEVLGLLWRPFGPSGRRGLFRTSFVFSFFDFWSALGAQRAPKGAPKSAKATKMMPKVFPKGSKSDPESVFFRKSRNLVFWWQLHDFNGFLWSARVPWTSKKREKNTQRWDGEKKKQQIALFFFVSPLWSSKSVFRAAPGRQGLQNLGSAACRRDVWRAGKTPLLQKNLARTLVKPWFSVYGVSRGR